MMTKPALKQFILIIRVACFALFIGRAWQHLFWDAPFRSLFWSQGIMQPIIESITNLTWAEWVKGGGPGDSFLNGLTRTFGIFYLICAIVSLIIKEHQKKMGWILILGALGIFQLSFLLFMGRGYAIGMLIEHCAQFGVPIVLYLTLFKSQNFKKYIFFFKLLVSLTFIGHGLYAIGYYPVPGKFIDMIINVFGMSEDNALIMLRFAGILDFSAGIFIFVPILEIYALAFNIFWGFTTAFARTVAYLDIDLLDMSAHQWIMETVFRFPHGFLPLALFLHLRQRKLDS